MFQINAPARFNQKLQNDYDFLTKKCSWLTVGQAYPCTADADLTFGTSSTNNLIIRKASCPTCPEHVGRLLIKKNVVVITFNPSLTLQQAIIPTDSYYILPVTKDFWLIMNHGVLLFIDHSRPLYTSLLKMHPMEINFAYDPKYRIYGYHQGRNITFTLNGQEISLEIEWLLSTSSPSILYFRDKTSGVCSYKCGRRVLVEYVDQQTFLIDFNYADHTFKAYIGCMEQTQNYIPQYVLAGERLWNYQYSQDSP